MKNFFIVLLTCCLAQWSFAQPCAVLDDAGRQVSLNHPAKRIISLAPDLTELLFAAGAGNQVVGVMKGSDYPAAAKKIPIVANFNSIDAEKILTLHPDLVVVWTEGNLAQMLMKLGIPFFLSHQKKVTDVASTIKKFGCLAGTQDVANPAAEIFLRTYQALQKKYAQRKTVTVFYQVWSSPLITVTKNSWINDVITLCGGKNIFADLLGAAPAVNLEAVIMANPDVIIGAVSKHDWQRAWRHWPQLTAIQKNNLITINPDVLERASPRLLEGAAELCRGLDLARDHLVA